jgi:hypothetical protein
MPGSLENAKFYFFFGIAFIIFITVLTLVLQLVSKTVTQTPVQGIVLDPVELKSDNQKNFNIEWTENKEGPDFVVCAKTVSNSMFVEHRTFLQDSCTIKERLITTAGRRKLLRFKTRVINIGNADLELGNPKGNMAFTWSSCRQQYQVRGFSEYILLDETKTNTLSGGHRQPLGVRDDVRVYDALNGIPTNDSSTYTFNDQGLSVGWANDSAANLDGQWVDVTDLAPGKYVLRIIVNTSVAISDILDVAFTLPVIQDEDSV